MNENDKLWMVRCRGDHHRTLEWAQRIAREINMELERLVVLPMRRSFVENHTAEQMAKIFKTPR